MLAKINCQFLPQPTAQEVALVMLRQANEAARRSCSDSRVGPRYPTLSAFLAPNRRTVRPHLEHHAWSPRRMPPYDLHGRNY